LFEEALGLSRTTGNPWAEADALAGLGEALALAGEEQQALELLRVAAAVSQEIGDRTGTAEARYLIAEVERRRGDLDGARRAAVEALDVVNEIRGVMGSAELRALFTATARRYHELHIDILMAQHERRPDGGHAVEALAASEETRARSLLEILAEADVGAGVEVPEELRRERSELMESLNDTAIRRQLLLEAKLGSEEPLRRVELELERLLTRLREVERRIRAASPRYATLTQPSPVEVEDIQRSILDPDTALLEYFLGEERSYLWVVIQEDLHAYELPPRAKIDRDARCLHWLITAYGDLPAFDTLEPENADCLADRLGDFREAQEEGHPLRRRGGQKRAIEGAFQALARDLSETLLGPPTQDGLLPFRLAIVSDGALEYVPFAALPDPAADGQPVVRAHEIVRHPSASVLALQRGKPLPADTSTGTLAIVADPIYELQDDRITGSLRRTKQDGAADLARAREPLPRHYPRLAYTREEAGAIAAFAPEDRTFVAMDHRASRETVQSGALSGYRYVHFATHGTLDTRFPELSSLVLSLVDENGNPRSDGFLRLNDIYGLDLDGTDMVVLSACETALGKEVRGEGLIGLTRGFQYAGARRVLSSLWRVQDRSTARLMENLYRGLLQEGRSPADSLRRAQLAVLDEAGGRSEFPYYWAGFVLQGEWR
jgi:CHAT domain-containing protein